MINIAVGRHRPAACLAGAWPSICNSQDASDAGLVHNVITRIRFKPLAAAVFFVSLSMFSFFPLGNTVHPAPSRRSEFWVLL